MKKHNGREVIRTYKQKVKFHCQVRGEVEQEVEVNVYAPITAPNPIFTSEEVSELLEQFETEPEGF